MGRVGSRIRSAATFPIRFWRYARLPRLTWVEEGRLAACSYPGDRALRALAADGVALLVNLHERPHPSAALARHGLTELHLPVPDFTPPSPEQLERGIAAIEAELASGRRVAVHCRAGLGRTGTLVACYLVGRGHSPDDAIARVRALRPGSVETPAQVAAVAAFARRAAGATSADAPRTSP